jgi:hypothetical protein
MDVLAKSSKNEMFRIRMYLLLGPKYKLCSLILDIFLVIKPLSWTNTFRIVLNSLMDWQYGEIALLNTRYGLSPGTLAG